MLRASMTVGRIHRCVWILLILLRCVQLQGIDRDRKLADLSHTAWTFKDGAPAEVHALAQTGDGFLWLGTATGLVRFDGFRFQPYVPPPGQTFSQRNVSALLAVPDGGIWIGYWYGGITFIHDGKVTEYGAAEGAPSHQVLALAQDRQGAIWAAAGHDGLTRLEGSRWERIGTDLGFAEDASTVFVDHAGGVWVGTPTTVEYLPQGAHRFQTVVRNLRPIVQSFAESPDGKLWMAEGGYGVRPVPSPGRQRGRAGPAVLVGAPAITFDREGSLWITTAGNGIRRVSYPESLRPPKVQGPSAWQFHDAQVEAFNQEDGLSGDYSKCVLQDREGNIWIGTSGGLDRFRQSPVVSVELQPISYPGALPIPSLHSFSTSALAAGDHGALWAAGIGPQVLLKTQDGKVLLQLRDQPVDCAYRDPNGVLWVATPSLILRIEDEKSASIPSKTEKVTYKYKYRGVVAGAGGLTVRSLKLPAAVAPIVSAQSRVKAMTRDSSGRLWISVESGTYRLENSTWTSLESLGGPASAATAEFTDSKGRIWFGFANLIALLDGDALKTYSRSDGVQIGGITSIQEQDNKILFGGEFGLEYFDGAHFQQLNSSESETFSGVSGIVPDSESGLWFCERRGIIHVPKAELRVQASGKVSFESFGLLDGLTAELKGALAAPSAIRTTDGRIWFATTKGVAWVDPQRIVRNSVPPPVSIVTIGSQNHPYPLSSATRFVAGTHEVEIGYTALSFTVPERVKFRYKLEGVDREWSNVGDRREADYDNLGPGKYRFWVIAANDDGIWNEHGAFVDFTIAPAYYQTWWFRAACWIFLSLLIWMLYRFRVHTVELRYMERNRTEEELRRARTELARISRVNTMGELSASLAHEIKQPIGAAVTNAEACLLFLNREQPDLSEAREAALEMTKDARRAAEIIERVRSLYRKDPSRYESLDINGVICDMCVLLQNEANRHSIALHTDLGEEPLTVTADRVQLQQVLMNLMLNAIEAMRDTHGELTIKSQLGDNHQVLISVCDTGLGLPKENAGQIFDAFFTTKSQGTGLGLAITRSVVESHGGRIWATTNPGAGATFHFTLPAANKGTYDVR